MKNNIKKIIVAFLSFVFLFVGQASFAGTNSVTWNTLQNDCHTIAIANETQGIGFGDNGGCWTGTNISSNSGDIIRVRVYYHNTGTSTADNTKIKIIKSPNGNSSTYYNFSGQIISDAGTFYSTNPSSVHLTVPTNTTFDYVKTYWYPNQTSGEEGTTLLDGQDGSEILGSGLEIGDIAPGGATQGTVIAEFKVNANTPPPANCLINDFKANPTTINQGGSSLLSWSLNSNCVSATINQGIGAVSVPSGTFTVRPTVLTTYTLTAKSSNGTTTTRTATVKVNSTPPPASCSISSFFANPTTINQGGFSLLSWSTSNCTTVNITPTVGQVSVNGTRTVSPTGTTTYTLTAKGSNGVSATRTATVKVNATTPNCSISDFSANPTTINQGGSSTLSWNTNNCGRVTLDEVTVLNSGTKIVSPASTKTYTLKAYSLNGTLADTKTKTVVVNQIIQTCKINSFSANPTTINQGGSSTLSWNTSNCVSVEISNLGYNVPLSGSQIVYPASTTTYVLTATDQMGRSISRSQTVTVNPIISNCFINDFDATPNPINRGGTSTLVWVTNINCSTTKLYQGDSLIAQAGQYGNKQVTPTRTTTYTLKAFKSNGTLGETRDLIVGVNGSISITTGNLIPSVRSCIITSGHNSCVIPFSWSTQNPVGTSVVTRDGVTGNYQIGNSGNNIPFSIKYNSSTFRLYNNSIELDHETVTSSCASGTNWNGSKCVSNIITPSCTINDFTSDPTNITRGESSMLKWNTSNCDRVTIDGVSVATSGTKIVYPTSTKTYNLVASKTGILPFETTAQTTVYVNDVTPGCFINEITADPININQGESSILRWDTVNCTNVTISNLSYQVPTRGEQEVWPTRTTTYTLTAYGQSGLPQTRSVTVFVNTIIPTRCEINSFLADPTSITQGESSTLRWETNNCNSVNIDGVNVATSGTKTVWPINTKTYTLNAFDSYAVGPLIMDQVTVYVDDINYNRCEITDFSASDTSIEEGDQTNLRWNTNNCDHVKISDIGTVPEDGDEDVSPNEDTTYILTAYDSDGHSITDSLRIYVDDGGSNNNDCSIDSFTADNTYIDQGDEASLRWRTSGCDDVSISNIGDVSDDGTENVSPDQTTTYVLRARGNGSESQSIQIRVGNDNNIYNSYVVTTIATNITENSAQINGLVTSTNNNNINTYFEYGTNVYLGMRTPSRPTNGNMSFSEYLTNLSPRTIYYFRAVSEGPNGVSRGAIEVFRTNGYINYNTNTNTNNSSTTTQIIREVVVQGTTVSGSESPIMLRIENRYQTIGVGDVIDYTVFYKNISSSRLTNPMVQVFIPKGITLLNSSRGTYSQDDMILSAPIEDLEPNAEGYIYLQARVDSIDSNMAQIVTTVVLIYTNPNGAQENAMAYVLNNPGSINLLGASAFSSGRIFGMSLIGWLLLIILILLLVLITRTYYYRRNTTVTTHSTTTQQ